LGALGRELLKEGQGRPVLTVHGDLQPANILEHRGTSAVIDPVGIAGPRELDVASAALYNDWGEESSARIRRLAKLTGTDPAFALRFGQLQWNEKCRHCHRLGPTPSHTSASAGIRRTLLTRISS
jgi:hypothetical protein